MPRWPTVKTKTATASKVIPAEGAQMCAFFLRYTAMMGKTDFNLDRFVAAQAPVYESALHELKAGRKQGHWMWFIFPQLRGLGHSSMAKLFGLASLEHAQQYLAHETLGPRLVACTEAVIDVDASSLLAIFGSPDDLKFRSSMTLFHLTSNSSNPIFMGALDRWCQGQLDERTIELLRGS